MNKRNLFMELKQGIEEIKQHGKGKVTLRTYKIEGQFTPSVTPKIIRAVRDRLNLSRTVFAHQLCVSPRTLEKWEQGISRPNMQAAALILLVRKYPDTIERLNALSSGEKPNSKKAFSA
ncbi:MAG: helix-turn-helix domain-containing protein [Nitrospirae bacterium]|nr:helix-turn-helix domain-containing protein [Nitrospirota bacterium]